MDSRLVLLKLFLNELGVSDSINEIDERKSIQKAVYLGQRLAGIDLGYRFGWYLRGPYSPSLTQDYYALADSLSAGDKEWEQKSLKPEIANKLKKNARVLNKPSNVILSDADWLELIASVDFLRNVRKCDDEEVRRILKKEKLRLVDFVDDAFMHLDSFENDQ